MRDMLLGHTRSSAGPDTVHTFDPWLTCKGHKVLDALVLNITTHWAASGSTRKRAPAEVDRENREAVLAAVFANLAFASATGRTKVGVSIRAAKQKTTRYDRPGFRQLPSVVGQLAGLDGLVTLFRSTIKGVPSTIAPEAWLKETLERFPAKAEAFGQAPGRETILLCAANGELVDYADPSGCTDALRADMQEINSSLAAADIALVTGHGNAADRVLHRRFLLPGAAAETERFDLGGGLEGGFWSRVPHSSIRIDGEEASALRFPSMLLRVAYIDRGLSPPGAEALSADHWPPIMDAVAADMLVRVDRLKRVPEGMESAIPRGSSGPKLRTEVLAAHPALSAVFEAGAATRLEFVASRTIVAAALELARAGIVGLPASGGFLVGRRSAAKAATIMSNAAEALTGYRLPVMRDGPS